MVVSGLVAGGVFCQDMGDVVLSQMDAATTSVNFTILDYQSNEVSSFPESYYPDNEGKIYISGLPELMEKYLEGESLSAIFNPTSGFNYRGLFATLRVEVSQNGNQIGQFEQLFFHCKSRTKVFPSTYPYFLSRHRQRQIFPDQPVIVSYLLRRDTALRCKVIYKENNIVMTENVLVPAAVVGNYTGIFQCSLTEVASLVSTEAENIIEFSFVLCEYENEEFTPIDEIRFVVDRNYTPDRTIFLFKNTFGVPEVLCMTGVNKRTSELEGTYSWISRKYRKVATDLTTLHTICSGWIDKVTHASIKDAIKSEEVYIIENLQITDQVTITDIDLDYETPRDTPLAAYITYRVSSKVQETFAREPMEGDEYEEGIFDVTFDETFE